MTSFLFAAAIFVLVMEALGLVRILRGPADADRILSVQLIGSGGVAVLLLLSAATQTPAIMDVALMLALLATFVSIAFLRDVRLSLKDHPDEPTNT
ncbi:MAG TPA: monovalent cation/H+ antiporter complex subunit F [Pseudolabrys sp.]|jgi:multicomponent Na+:H+ antiporter subunit F|nr:monovalent cation/H+ antiporter complex subunit F [Pseudolabrys sp.]